MRSVHFGFAPALIAALALPQLAPAQFSVIYNFNGVNNSLYPQTTLVEIAPGVFLGSAEQEVFRINSNGVLGDVMSFANSTYDYALPGPLTPASNGQYYGVRYSIGELQFGQIYSIPADGQVSSVVGGLVGYASPLMEAADGYLYGTTATASNGFALFKLSLSGEMAIVANGLTGRFGGPPLQASDGNFYGASSFTTGKTSNIYRITPLGEITILHTFPSGETGAGPLIEAAGTLYGTATYGLSGIGACEPNTPVGEVYSLSLSGQYRTLQTLSGCSQYFFGPNPGPNAGLVEGSDGYLYGSTVGSGTNGDGTIFRLLPDGSGFEDVVQFDLANGFGPQTYGPAMVQGSDGVFYGTTAFGGSVGSDGVVFRLNLGLTPPLPRLELFYPGTGSVGDTVRLRGDHLIGLSGVSFNGIPAQFVALNVNYAYATVPAGAVTGPITVTTMNGSYTTPGSFRGTVTPRSK